MLLFITLVSVAFRLLLSTLGSSHVDGCVCNMFFLSQVQQGPAGPVSDIGGGSGGGE